MLDILKNAEAPDVFPAMDTRSVLPVRRAFGKVVGIILLAGSLSGCMPPDGNRTAAKSTPDPRYSLPAIEMAPQENGGIQLGVMPAGQDQLGPARIVERP